MYGLGKEPKAKFAFDLEKEIKESPAQGKKMLEKNRAAHFGYQKAAPRRS